MIKLEKSFSRHLRHHLLKSASKSFKTVRLHNLLFTFLIVLLPTQLGRHFWPEWSYILGLRVDYLSPTIYLTDLLVIGILGLWGFEKFKAMYTSEELWPPLRFGLPARPTGGPPSEVSFLFSIFLFLLVNVFLAQNQGAALYKLIKILEFAFLGFYVSKNFSISQYPRILISFSLSVIYSSLIAICQFLRQSSLNGILWWLGERTFSVATPGIAKAIINGRLMMRPYATFSHPNVLAGFLLVAIILLLGNFKSTNQLINKFKNNWLIGIYWILVFILALIGLVISFSRSAWIVSLLVLLPITCHLSPKKKIFLAVFLLVVLGLIGVIFFSPQFSTEETISQRVVLSKVAVDMIKSSPLNGAGLNNFIVRLPEFWSAPETIRFLQPVHNIFLLVAAETGLVGLTIIFWFLILTYKKIHRSGKHPGSEAKLKPGGHPRGGVVLAMALSAILTLGLIDHYWLTLQQTQLLLTIVLGLGWGRDR